jgi:hypothetical protein
MQSLLLHKVLLLSLSLYILLSLSFFIFFIVAKYLLSLPLPCCSVKDLLS